MVEEANLSAMTEAQTALAELAEISSQVEAAVLFDGSGSVTASTLPDEQAARLASSARALLASADRLREGELTQVEAATGEGSLFVARDGERVIAAVTGPDPTAGLVFYDLRSCLRRAAEKPKPKRRPRTKASGLS
jgi:predicted regulator of Ras-like GTPase activity (Roadblock/LC7/MglB family)